MSPEDIATLRQDGYRAQIDDLFSGPWITLYRHRKPEAWYSALLAPHRVAQALSTSSWDIDWTNWRPGIVVYGSGENAEATYERFPKEGIEALVYARDRDGAPPLVEVAEELRLFLDLFPGPQGSLVGVGSSGEEDVVVRIAADEVRILKAPLLRYL